MPVESERSSPVLVRLLVRVLWASSRLRAWMLHLWPPGRARRALVHAYFVRLYAEINRSRALPANHLHRDFALRFPPDLVELGTIETLHGDRAIARMFDALGEGFADVRWLPERVLETPDGRFVAFVLVEAIGGGSGVAIRKPVAIVASMANGRLERGEMYMDRGDALAAAGLAGRSG